MTISEVSKMYDFTPDTIRYYEKIGLLRDVPRTKNGIRNFDENACNWLSFIKCMRNAGITIDVLCEYVDLMHKGKSTAEERMKLLKNEREKLIQKQIELNETLDRLNQKIEVYGEILKGNRKDFVE